MIKKLAGAAVGTLLITSIVMGTSGIAAAVGNAPEQAAAPTSPAAVTPVAELPEATNGAYLFVHFAGNEGNANHEQIYFSVSTDGNDWHTLNGGDPVLTSDKGEKGVRDPHIIRLQENAGFAIVATDLSIFNRHGEWGDAQTGGSKNIIVWKSNGNSLTDWSDSTAIDVGSSYNALDVWAPETVWDPVQGKYMVFWASIVGQRKKGDTPAETDWLYRIYRSYTTDFENFTEAEVYMEREDSVIDTTFYYDDTDEMYYRFTKTEGGDKNWVFMEQGKTIDGDFVKVAGYRVDGKKYSQMGGYEGPTLYKLNDSDKICLLLDHYGASAGYAPYTTEDISEGKFTTAGTFNFNGVKFRHGSVIPITTEEYNSLVEAYPGKTTPVDPGDPDKTTGGTLIYDLDFEDETFNATVGSEYTATPTGSFSFVQGKKEGKKAAEFTVGKFLTLSGDLFKGKDNLTVIFDVQITGEGTNGTSWLLFAAPNANKMSDPRHYYGLLFKSGKVFSAERYNNQGWSGDNDAYDDTQAQNKWVTVAIVYYKQYTKLFIDGQLASGKPMAEAVGKISEIVLDNPTVYIGKANWGDGEYCTMHLDRFRVYDYAIPDANMQVLYQSDLAS